MSIDKCITEFTKPSYLTGEEIGIRLVFDTAANAFKHLSNISIDLHRVERGRNQFAFGFGAKPQIEENVLQIAQKLDPGLPLGLYVLQNATLCWGTEIGQVKQQRIQFPPVFFVIQTVFDRPVSTRELAIRVAEAENERTSYVNSPTYTGAVQDEGTTRKQFRVLVFGVGCLLHTLQQLEGYSIAPTGRGMSHRRLHEIVNEILAKLSFPSLKFNSEFETQFEHGSPTFVITYANVIAVNETDALDTCRAHRHASR